MTRITQVDLLQEFIKCVCGGKWFVTRIKQIDLSQEALVI